jgi:hypothetical protein
MDRTVPADNTSEELNNVSTRFSADPQRLVMFQEENQRS